MGGCNTNLMVRQFSAAFMELLVLNDILLDITSCNCRTLEFVPIITASSQCTANNVTQYSVKIINTPLLKSKVRDETTKVHADNYYIYIA